MTTCPTCHQPITSINTEEGVAKYLNDMNVHVDGPSQQEVAQARFNRDLAVGKSVVEVPANVTIPTKTRGDVVAGAMMGLVVIIWLIAMGIVVITHKEHKGFL